VLLRGSNGFDGPDSALAAISGADCETGVASGAAILAFAEAIMESDKEKLARARNVILDQLGEGGLVECSAVAANFSQMVRIADSTGIPLDPPLMSMADPIRDVLKIDNFESAKNTI